MMRERPILMNGAMVRAILSGAKTQTRRVVKGAFEGDDLRWYQSNPLVIGRGREEPGPEEWRAWAEDCSFPSPFGIPGDRLWVRETWQIGRDHIPNDGRPKSPDGERCLYAATEPDALDADDMSRSIRWRPSIHMPRWASRLTLEVTDIRVERLQAISEEDAKAEGIDTSKPVPARINGKLGTAQAFDPRIGFAWLWDSIYTGPESWASNPWVWVVSFRRVE